MMRTAAIEPEHRQVSVNLPYRATRGEAAEAALTVRALDGLDELGIEEDLERRYSAARIASSIIGRCASDAEGAIGLEGARALSAGDREVVLRGIYGATFGGMIEAQVECGAGCGEAVCFEIELAALTRAPDACPGSDCRVPDGRDLEGAAEGEAIALAALAEAGNDPEAIARLDPNAECEIALTCPSCENGFSAWLDGFELIRRQVCSERGILAQVDQLASAYGWSETEILSLPRDRRLRYCAFAEGRAA